MDIPQKVLDITRKTAAKPLGDIAEVFGLTHYGCVSGKISGIAKRMQQDKLRLRW
ncbi:MAG: hypothetical protein PVF82_09780 [Gammaproteobacteria bacterium]